MHLARFGRVALLLTASAHAYADDATGQALAAVQATLVKARKSLESGGNALDADQRQRLAAALSEAEAATARYARLSQQGDARQAALAPLAVAAGAVVADDVSGVGAADDVLLPFIGIAALVALCTTHRPADKVELDEAWQKVIVSLTTLARVTEAVTEQVNRRKKRDYLCTAKCHANNGPGGAHYIFGYSKQNCGEAIRAAKATAPPGEYPRHCSCSDTDGFRGVGHQCEVHTR